VRHDGSPDGLCGSRQLSSAAICLVALRLKLFLLDEPLASLDLKLREALENELRDMHRERGQTFIYASHDFLGTAAIASRIAVIDNRRLLQTGTLAENYTDPLHRRVGELIGSPAMALLEARVRGDELAIDGYPVRWPLSAVDLGARTDGAKVTVGLWFEDISIETAEAPGLVPVTATDFRGRDQAIEVRFGVNRIRKVIPIRTRLTRGANCFIRLDPAKAFPFDLPGGSRIRANSVSNHELDR